MSSHTRRYDPKNVANWSLLLLRIAVGASFIGHGIQKWAQWDMPTKTLLDMCMKLLAIVEPVMGAATILGLLSPVAAATLAAVMVGAIYTKIFTWDASFIGKTSWELDFVLLASNAVLLAIGAGAFSLDEIMKGGKKGRKK